MGLHTRRHLSARKLLPAALLAAACATSSTAPSVATTPPAPAEAAASAAPVQPPADASAIADELRRRIDRAMSVQVHIQVEVDRNGVATLSGFINSESEREQAVNLAKRTPGVTAVVEDLRVVPITGPDRSAF